MFVSQTSNPRDLTKRLLVEFRPGLSENVCGKKGFYCSESGGGPMGRATHLLHLSRPTYSTFFATHSTFVERSGNGLRLPP